MARQGANQGLHKCGPWRGWAFRGPSIPTSAAVRAGARRSWRTGGMPYATCLVISPEESKDVFCVHQRVFVLHKGPLSTIKKLLSTLNILEYHLLSSLVLHRFILLITC